MLFVALPNTLTFSIDRLDISHLIVAPSGLRRTNATLRAMVQNAPRSWDQCWSYRLAPRESAGNGGGPKSQLGRQVSDGAGSSGTMGRREWDSRTAHVKRHDVSDGVCSPGDDRDFAVLGRHAVGAQPAGHATDLTSRYCANPAVPFWRPTPLIL